MENDGYKELRDRIERHTEEWYGSEEYARLYERNKRMDLTGSEMEPPKNYDE